MHRQIARQIASAIRNGDVADGARLPSTRAFAKLLGVSRNTVLAAYDELAAGGLLAGAPGSGMRVLGRRALFPLHEVVKASGYPARTLTIEDPDLHALYLRY
jgi:GntR family transcriptional regulator/MocR family aminotransferase